MLNTRCILALLLTVLCAPALAHAQQAPASADPSAPVAQQPAPPPGSVLIGAPEPGAAPWGTQPVIAPPTPVPQYPQYPPPQPPPYGYGYPPPQPQPYYPMSSADLMRNDRERSNRRLIAGGAAIFGALYLLTAIIAVGQLSDSYSSSSEQTEGYINLIPVAGPYVNAVRTATSGDEGAALAAFLYVLDGLGQTAGAIMFFAGVTRPSAPQGPPGPQAPRTATRSQHFDWHVLPAAAGTTAGATFVARF